jgi:hypothetical protein
MKSGWGYLLCFLIILLESNAFFKVSFINDFQCSSKLYQKQDLKLSTNQEILSTATAENLSLVQLSKSMQNSMNSFKDKYILEEGKFVDYETLKSSSELSEFANMLNYLSKFAIPDVVKLSNSARMAFFINVYNSLVIYANAMSESVPTTPTERSAFFNGSSGVLLTFYDCKLSLDAIEHGILRGNRAHPSLKHLSNTFFDPTDRRSLLAIHPFDPRIHFVLNCGAVSCPPIRVIDEITLEKSLNIATKAYLQSEVRVDLINNIIALPMLLKWYGYDFGESFEDQLSFIVQSLLPTQTKTISPLALQIQQLIAQSNYTVTYNAYDWTQNRF